MFRIKTIIIFFVVVVCLAAICTVWLTWPTNEYVVTQDNVDTDVDVYEQQEDVPQTPVTEEEEEPKKIAYLTFDDGPSANTVIILDALKQYDIKATFFVLGEKAEQNPELVQRIFDEGHTIGNHTYDHVYDKVYGTREEFEWQLLKWEEAVGGIIGRENLTKLFRFPGGSKDDWKYIYRDIADEMGYKYVDWTALNGDADGQPFSEERCMEEIAKYCTGEKDVVILMHDSAKKDITAQMMPQIIEYLIGQGYDFKRIEV